MSKNTTEELFQDIKIQIENLSAIVSEMKVTAKQIDDTLFDIKKTLRNDDE